MSNGKVVEMGVKKVECSLGLMSYDESKFPHLVSVNQSIVTTKKMIDLLNKRKLLINEDLSSKSDYEKNEIEITIIKTDIELSKSHKSLNDKETYFKEYVTLTTKYIDEVNEKYDALVERANSYKITGQAKEDVSTLFENVKSKDLVNDWDARIHHYIALKTLVYPKKV